MKYTHKPIRNAPARAEISGKLKFVTLYCVPRVFTPRTRHTQPKILRNIPPGLFLLLETTDTAKHREEFIKKKKLRNRRIYARNGTATSQYVDYKFRKNKFTHFPLLNPSCMCESGVPPENYNATTCPCCRLSAAHFPASATRPRRRRRPPRPPCRAELFDTLNCGRAVTSNGEQGLFIQ